MPILIILYGILDPMKGPMLMALLIEARGMTPHGIAKAARGSQPQLHRYIAGKAREPKPSTLEPFARYLGVPVSAFYDERQADEIVSRLTGRMPADGKDGVGHLEVMRPAVTVGIVSVLQAATDSHFVIEMELPDGVPDKAPYYGTDPDAYAVLMRGNLGGRIVSGDKLILEPHTKPLPGDIARVGLKDGKSTIKRLMYVRDGEVCLEAWKGELSDLVLLETEVSYMHKVVSILPR
jgi:SOS-response transcriptional repressor LexA